MAESLDSMKEKNRSAEEPKGYEEKRYQSLEEELKLLQRQVASQRSETGRVAERELPHRVDSGESELERKKAELELLQRQIATKRGQLLKSAETERLQRQIAIGEVYEKDTGDLRNVERIQSETQERNMPIELTSPECAIANRKTELERLQRQIAMERKKQVLRKDSEIERQSIGTLQTEMRDEKSRNTRTSSDGQITDKQDNMIRRKEEETALLHDESRLSVERMKSHEDTQLEVFPSELDEREIMETLVRSAEKKEEELQRLRSQIALRKRQASLNAEKQILSEMLTRLTQSTDHNARKNIVHTYRAYDSKRKDKPDKAKEDFNLQEVRHETVATLTAQEQQRDSTAEIPRVPIESSQRGDSLDLIDREIRDLDLRLETLKQDEIRDTRRKEETENLLKTSDKESQRRDVKGGHIQEEQTYSRVQPRKSEYDKTHGFSLHMEPLRTRRNKERETGLDQQIDYQRVGNPVNARRQLKFGDSLNYRSVAEQTPNQEKTNTSFYDRGCVPQESKNYDRQTMVERGPAFQYSSAKDFDSLKTLPEIEKDYYQEFRGIHKPRSDYSASGYKPMFSQGNLTRKAECLATDHKYNLRRNIKSENPLQYGMIKTELPDMLNSLTLERIRLEDMNRRELFLKDKEEALINKERELEMRERILELREEIKNETQVEKEANTSQDERNKVNKNIETDVCKQQKEETQSKETVCKRTSDTVTTDKANSIESMSCQDKTFMYPKFTLFSGEDPKPKGEATFEEWKYEVCCALKDEVYKEYAIAQAIRKSLKSQAKRVLLPMGTTATVKEILERLEGVFGNVATGESVLQEFYTAAQKADESVTTWGLRLEEILQKAVIKGHVKSEDKTDMLRNNFWKHLRSEKLKNSTRVHFESISNFELLRRAVRAEEYEIKVNTGIQHQPTRTEVKSEQKDKQDSKMDTLINRLASLEKEMKEMRKNRGFNYRKRFQYNQPKQEEKKFQHNQPKQDETKLKEPLNKQMSPSRPRPGTNAKRGQ